MLLTFPERQVLKWSQSPQTGQFNSYLAENISHAILEKGSQSPQTGQFNSYKLTTLGAADALGARLNPLKRVNSILTMEAEMVSKGWKSLNPLKRVNSILTRLVQLS